MRSVGYCLTRPLKATAYPSAALQGKRRLSGNVDCPILSAFGIGSSVIQLPRGPFFALPPAAMQLGLSESRRERTNVQSQALAVMPTLRTSA